MCGLVPVSPQIRVNTAGSNRSNLRVELGGGHTVAIEYCLVRARVAYGPAIRQIELGVE
jgi:hypothetical protein